VREDAVNRPQQDLEIFRFEVVGTNPLREYPLVSQPASDDLIVLECEQVTLSFDPWIRRFGDDDVILLF